MKSLKDIETFHPYTESADQIHPDPTVFPATNWGFISPTLDLSVLVQKVDPPACAIAVCHGQLRRQPLFVNGSNP